MKRLIIRIIIFLSPILLFMIIAILLDPFKVFFDYEDPYKDTFVTLNRENVVVERFEELYNEWHYNSFIFGNSRSQAFHCLEWMKYLPDNAKPFHFDTNGESILGIKNKLNFLQREDVNLNNALLVLDEQILNFVEERESHIYSIHPKLSGGSNIHYYAKFLKKSLNPSFFAAYTDYKLFDEKRDYMEGYIRSPNYHSYSPQTADVYFHYEEEIKNDSIAYYKDKIKKGIFFNRTGLKKDTADLKPKAKEYLKEIAQILKSQKSQFKIVLSPLYNQRKLSQKKVAYLERLFGVENIYNFSGKNDYNELIGNFYESSHYRPFIAKKIMAEIYKKN